MPTFIVTAPDGRKLRITAPEGATQEQAISYAQQQMSQQERPQVTADSLRASNPSEYDPSSPEFQAKYGATSGMGGGQRFLAGAGKAFVDIARGAGQWVGAVNREDVAASRERDAPLMRSGAAKAGNLLGNVAATLPALAIPGANTVVGAGAIGAGLGAVQPTVNTRETLTNIGLGTALSAGGQAAGNAIAGKVAAKAATKATERATEKSLNAARDAVIAESRAAGYVIPPTAAKASAANTALESVAGKAALRQDAAFRNARVTNRLVAEDLGLPATGGITRKALREVRRDAGKAYEAIKQVGRVNSDDQFTAALRNVAQAGDNLEAAYPGIGSQASSEVQSLVQAVSKEAHDADNLVSLSKFLRNRATANFKAAFGSGGNPERLEIARAQSGVVDAIEDLLSRHLDNVGNPELASSWRAARTTIAKSYQAEAALRGSNVSAVRLAQQLQRGKPMSGGMGTAARFADMFDEVAKIPKSGAGVSKLGAVVGGTGAATALMTGNPALAGTLAASPLASFGIRRGLLTPAMQRALATPSYGGPLVNRLAAEGVEGVGRYGALPLTNQYLSVQGRQ
jgi:hypothetical protein